MIGFVLLSWPIDTRRAWLNRQGQVIPSLWFVYQLVAVHCKCRLWIVARSSINTTRWNEWASSDIIPSSISVIVNLGFAASAHGAAGGSQWVEWVERDGRERGSNLEICYHHLRMIYHRTTAYYVLLSI